MKKRRKELYLSCSLLNRGHIAKYGISLYCIYLLSLLPRWTDDDADRNFWSIKYKRACNNHNTHTQEVRRSLSIVDKNCLLYLSPFCVTLTLSDAFTRLKSFFFQENHPPPLHAIFDQKNIQRFTQCTGGTVQAWCVGLLKSLLDKKKKTCRR